MHRVVRALGFTPQKPERRAKQQDPKAVEAFREEVWPALGKGRRRGRTLVVIDETGLMMQPTYRRTWAPAGETPIIVPSAKHDRWSVIGALTISPERRRLGLYFLGFDHNITGDDCESFIWSLHQHLRKPLLVVVWDGLSGHRTAARRFVDEPHRAVFQRLPPYAPQLNPVEWLWSHTKFGRMANFCPDSFEHLGDRVASTLLDTRSEHELLRSFFQGANLSLHY